MRHLTLLILFLLLAACSSQAPVTRPVPEPTPIPQEVVAENPQPAKGSLYKKSKMLALFSDRSAYRVGDILTVVLNERTQSSKRAATSIGKDTEIDVGVPIAGKLNTEDLNLSLNSNSEFDGSSEANQENFLRGAISVRVVAVLPNGSLQIMGQKHLTLNQGDEYIRLQGIVRPEDIDVTNRISSQRIADATISYVGKGSLANASSPGWFTRFFTGYLNPF